jgi:UDP-N-acetylglucosamine acyltransferase
MGIHHTAVIDSKAKIDPSVEIGPYVVIEGEVKIQRATRIMAQVYIGGWTEIGENNEIHPGVVLGDAPQDRAYKGEETYLTIGDNNVFREHVQVHRGTVAGSSTTIGHDNFLMANSHVAHNCKLGSSIVLANGALLAGYVEVEDSVIDSCNSVVHKYDRNRKYAIMSGLSGTSRDVPPYAIVDWQHTIRGVNTVGLKRAGFDERRIREIRQAFRVLFQKGRNLSLAIKEIEELGRVSEDVLTLLEFIKSSKRGVCLGPSE